MGLCDVLIFANNNDTSSPKIFEFIFVVLHQPLENVISLADVNDVSHWIVWIRADKTINPGAPYFLSLRQLRQFCTG